MKCLYCEKEFKLIPVGKSGGNNRNFCYNCLPINYTRLQRQRRTNELIIDKARQQKKQIGCSICGYNKNGAALEWHHIDPLEKDGAPAEMLKLGTVEGWNQYQKEIKKCILVCANCHREIHNPEKELEFFDGDNEIKLLHNNIIQEYQNCGSIRQVAIKLNLGESFIDNVLTYNNVKLDKRKVVLMLDKATGQVIKQFNSTMEASRELLGDDSGNSHISSVCNGKRKSAYGYSWKYKTEI